MEDLLELRKELDHIDRQLLTLLAERFAVTEKVGQFKAAHDLPPVDEVREASQEERVLALAQEVGLDLNFAKKHLRLIIDAVVARHKEIIASHHE